MESVYQTIVDIGKALARSPEGRSFGPLAEYTLQHLLIKAAARGFKAGFAAGISKAGQNDN